MSNNNEIFSDAERQQLKQAIIQYVSGTSKTGEKPIVDYAIKLDEEHLNNQLHQFLQRVLDSVEQQHQTNLVELTGALDHKINDLRKMLDSVGQQHQTNLAELTGALDEQIDKSIKATTNPILKALSPLPDKLNEVTQSIEALQQVINNNETTLETTNAANTSLTTTIDNLQTSITGEASAVQQLATLLTQDNIQQIASLNQNMPDINELKQSVDALLQELELEPDDADNTNDSNNANLTVSEPEKPTPAYIPPTNANEITEDGNDKDSPDDNDNIISGACNWCLANAASLFGLINFVVLVAILSNLSLDTPAEKTKPADQTLTIEPDNCSGVSDKNKHKTIEATHKITDDALHNLVMSLTIPNNSGAISCNNIETQSCKVQLKEVVRQDKLTEIYQSYRCADSKKINIDKTDFTTDPPFKAFIQDYRTKFNSSGGSASAQPAQLATASTQGTTYTVKKGDSLSKIVKEYGLKTETGVDCLKQFNSLSSDNLEKGQTLNIPTQQYCENLTNT